VGTVILLQLVERKLCVAYQYVATQSLRWHVQLSTVKQQHTYDKGMKIYNKTDMFLLTIR
jgi:hypothetical protein